MATIRFKGTSKGNYKDHKQLDNIGENSHKVIDEYLEEVDGARGDHTSVGDRIRKVEAGVVSRDTEIADLVGKDKEQDSKLASHGASIKKIDEREGAQDGVLKGLASDITNLKDKDDTQDDEISASKAVVGKLSVRVTDNGGKINAVTDLVAVNTGNIKENKEAIEGMSLITGDVEGIIEEVGVIFSDLGLLTDRVGVLEEGYATSKEVIDARTDKDGVVYDNLKARLDTTQGVGGDGSGGNSGGGDIIVTGGGFLNTITTVNVEVIEDIIVLKVPKEVKGDNFLLHYNGQKLAEGIDYTNEENTLTFNTEIYGESNLVFTVFEDPDINVGNMYAELDGLLGEVIDARESSKGEVYPTLKDRIDSSGMTFEDMETEIVEVLEETTTVKLPEGVKKNAFLLFRNGQLLIKGGSYTEGDGEVEFAESIQVGEELFFLISREPRYRKVTTNKTVIEESGKPSRGKYLQIDTGSITSPEVIKVPIYTLDYALPPVEVLIKAGEGWGMATPGRDYTYIYKGNEMEVILMTSGRYKINYQE